MSKKKLKPTPGRKVARKPEPESKYKAIISLYSPWLILALCSIIYVIARISFTDIPLNRDEGTYAYLGKVAMSGGVPYWDFYEMKPPGLYYFYGMLGGIFGYGESGLRIGLMVLNILNAWWIYKISSELFKEKAPSIVAAALFLIFSLSKGVFGHSAVAEQPVIAFVLPSLFLLVRSKSGRDLIGAGILMALAMTMKQSAIFLFLFALLYLAFKAFLDRSSFKEGFKSYVAFTIPIAIIGFLVLGLLYFYGDWSEFIYWIYEHPKEYVSSDATRSATVLFQYFGNKFLLAQWPLMVLVIIGTISSILIIKKYPTISAFILLLAICSGLALIPGKRFYPQYWMLLLPVLAISAGFLYYLGEKLLKGILWPILIIFIGAIVLDFITNTDYYLVNDEKSLSDELYSGNPFYEIKQLCNYMNSIMQPGDRLYVLGSEPQAYLYTDTDALTRHIFPGTISSNNPRNEARQNEAYDNLERSNPEFILLNIVPYSWSIQEGDLDYLYRNGYVFATNNYKQVGVADYAPGRSNIVLGEEARNYMPKSSSYVILYQKR
jgi:hypothetical protein